MGSADMPVLAAIRERFAEERPLAGLRVGACLHVTTETANLMRTLKAGGADIVLCASNPLSTQDDVAAALVHDYGIRTYAIKGEDNETYYSHIDAAIDHKPQMTMDDGADVVGRDPTEATPSSRSASSAAPRRPRPASSACARWRRPACSSYPIIAVNDANTKHLFDNRYGTGQSTLDGIIRATNLLFAGTHRRRRRLRLVRARRRDARRRAWAPTSSSREVDPLRALEAVMDGYRVMPMQSRPPRSATSASPSPATSTSSTRSAFDAMKDGAIICQLRPLQRRDRHPGAARARRSPSARSVRFVEEFTLADGRSIYLLAEAAS